MGPTCMKLWRPSDIFAEEILWTLITHEIVKYYYQCCLWRICNRLKSRAASIRLGMTYNKILITSDQKISGVWSSCYDGFNKRFMNHGIKDMVDKIDANMPNFQMVKKPEKKNGFLFHLLKANGATTTRLLKKEWTPMVLKQFLTEYKNKIPEYKLKMSLDEPKSQVVENEWSSILLCT